MLLASGRYGKQEPEAFINGLYCPAVPKPATEAPALKPEPLERPKGSDQTHSVSKGRVLPVAVVLFNVGAGAPPCIAGDHVGDFLIMHKAFEGA